MITKEIPPYYLECLRQDLAKAVGRSIDTYSDFNYLFLELKKAMKNPPSISTLKRLWAYVPDASSRSRSTLNSLARFLGFKDWIHYMENLMRDNRVESGFIGVNTIATSSLENGDRIDIKWFPDRLISIEYIGDNTFSVIKSENTKLKTGFTFTSLLFTKGMPLCCTDVSLNGENFGIYIAGRKTGISSISFYPFSKTPSHEKR